MPLRSLGRFGSEIVSSVESDAEEDVGVGAGAFGGSVAAGAGFEASVPLGGADAAGTAVVVDAVVAGFCSSLFSFLSLLSEVLLSPLLSSFFCSDGSLFSALSESVFGTRR